jgi:hypothetical protein
MASGKYMIEFTPKSGSDLTDYDNIEVYLTGTDNVNYDGLQVAYTGANGRQTEVLTAADYTVEIDGDEATYTIPVKEAWKNSSDVVVSLRNFISKAGESNYSEAKYNAFVVTGINPTSGSTLGFLNTGDVVSIQTNRSKNIKNFVYEIHDLNAETADDFIIKSLSYLSTDADSTTWTASVYGSYKFYTGHKYSFVFKAYNTQSIAGTPFATDSIVINGGTTPYEYSDTQFESISPVAGTALTDATEGVFTLTFDGLVNLSAETTFINLGQGATLAFAKIENLTDDTKYGNQWRLTLPEGYLEQHPGALSLTVVAVDLLGKRVQGNQGEDEGTYFNFAYTNTVGVPTVTCTDPAEGVSVESLSVITLTCTDGIAESYIGGQIEVKKAMTGETVATVTEIEPVYTSDNWDDPATSMKLKLSQTLTEGGRYFVTIPEGYFYLGSQAQYTSEALTFGFVIEPKDDETPSDATPVVADPADGSTVTSLKEIVLTFTGEKGAGEEWNCSDPINVTDAAGNVVATVNDLGWGDEDNQIKASLSQEITADGVYTISFPAGKFALGEEGDHWSTAFTLTYTIGTASGINTIATDKVAALSVYNLQGACVLRHADAAAVKALPAGIYVINGVKTVIR